MGRKRTIYAIYKGDKFICEGTAKECAEKLGIKEKTIWFMSSPACLKRDKGNRRIAILVEE